MKIRAHNNIPKLLYIMALVAVFSVANAKSSFTEEKRLVKSFAAGENTVMTVQNKYGRVSVETWEKDSIRFEILFSATDKTIEDAMEMLDEVDVSFSSSLHFIKAETDFQDDGVSIITGINRLTESITNAEVQLNVHYRILCPTETQVEIENKFGDVIIDKRSGRTQIQCSHGDVRVDELDGHLDLELKFGDFNAQYIKRLDFECEYSDVVVYKIDNANINSKSSKLNLQQVLRLRAETKRDDYTLYKVSDLSCDGSYTDWVITQLSGGINLRGKYCHLTVHEILKDFNRIMINADKSHANLSFTSNSSFLFDISIEEGDFVYPKTRLTKVNNEGRGENIKSYGYYGTQDSRSSLEVIGEESNVNLSIH